MKKLLENPYLKAVRNGLTLTLPLVMAGSLAVLVSNFPLSYYQDFMVDVFGERWRMLSVHISHGTFTILSIIMLLTISFSLAEYENTRNRKRNMHPAIVALVSLGCLTSLFQPYSLDPAVWLDMEGFPLYWMGIHGLFLSIFVAFFSTLIFFRLRKVNFLNISFYSEEADVSVSYAFSALLPGMITIVLFALFKTILEFMGITSIHQLFYDLLREPFTRMGNTFGTALFYTFIRHFFWFFGIHGTNLMEPVTVAIYVPAVEHNAELVAQGLAPTEIFTKTFFDAFVAIGGSGSTTCLLLAVFISCRRGSMLKISQISLLPALFNINEMVMFGLPIVLNPIFLIPFLLVPLVQCSIAYFAMYWGLVPLTERLIDWTAPAFIGGYAATGSYAGALLQFFNLVIGAVIYLPFVRIANTVKKDAFNRAFKELLPGNAGSAGDGEYELTPEARALSHSLANDLADAIDKKEISLEYQPQVESTTGKVFGVEALMRWDHSHLGRIPPSLFISLAEEAGLIKRLGSWALEESCRQLDEWRRLGIDDVTMSVNLSVHQLDDGGILSEIQKRVERYAIPKGRLEVEVTESTALGGSGARTDMLHAIHALGVSLAIDDFGMGHSSLVYLKQFPVDTIKIDRVLSKDVATSRHSSEIIFTISELCKSLDIECLVEFVDNVEQLKALQNLGCTRIQGWLYSPSLPADKCLDYIQKGAEIY